jgi:hypothetical protein
MCRACSTTIMSAGINPYVVLYFLNINDTLHSHVK